MFFYKKKAWLVLILIDVFLIYYKYNFADISKATASSHESEYKPYQQIKVCHKRVSQYTSVWWSKSGGEEGVWAW